MDTISKIERSENMRRIRSCNTSPEMVIRRLLFRMGYRYRLFGKYLPGKPDIVFYKRKKVIFVHGCFWHHHDLSQCIDSKIPKSNSLYWKNKLDNNVKRDQKNVFLLNKMGWDVLIIWECEIKCSDSLKNKLLNFLS